MNDNIKKITMKKRKDNNLAEGEVTGHAHRCTGNVKVFDIENGRLLDAPDGCEVTHEEHETCILPPGKYNTFVATEQDHAREETRKVMD